MSQPIDEIGETLLMITQSMVDHPADVQIDPIRERETVTFRVQTHPEDTGKLIGANGRTAQALRVLLNANGAKLKLRLVLDICSPGER